MTMIISFDDNMKKLSIYAYSQIKNFIVKYKRAVFDN